MKERIKQLVDQVALDMPEIYNTEYESGEKGVELTEQSLEKFAELIVQECADVLDKRIAPPNHPMNSLGYKLKQHFGVSDEG